MKRRVFLKKTLGSLAFTGLAGTFSNTLKAENPKKKPNIVFLLADDLGWLDTGCYGSKYFETPNIDKLAAEGMRFTQAYADAPSCTPTRAAILTGKHPARLQLTHVMGRNSPSYFEGEKLIEPEFKENLDQFNNIPLTIAKLLKKNGYKTGKFGKTGATKRPGNSDEFGFDVMVHDFGSVIKGKHYKDKKNNTVWSYEEYINHGSTEEGKYYPDCKTDKALNFIEKNKDDPFFLYMPYNLVHEPIMTRNHWLVEKYKKKKDPTGLQGNPTYGAMITSMDWKIGRLIDKLKETGVYDNTIIFFFSDNGPRIKIGKFYEKHYKVHSRLTTAAPLYAGKASIYEGGVRMPFIVRWPGKVKAKTVCGTPVSSVDFFPTIVEMTGTDIPKNLVLDGESITPVLNQESSVIKRKDGSVRETFFWHVPHHLNFFGQFYGAIRHKNYKLYEYFEDGRLELFDIEKDIGETKDISSEKPEMVKKMHKMLKDWRKRVSASMPITATKENIESKVKTFRKLGKNQKEWPLYQPPKIPPKGSYPHQQ